MAHPKPHRSPKLLRRIAALLIRSPEAGFILDDLDELLERDLTRGVPPWRVRWRYGRNLLASAFSVWRANLRITVPRGVSWLDFKLGFRMLVKYPGLTIVGGIAIAFAIAVGASTFELVTRVVDPTLPLEGGDRIVGLRLWHTATSSVEEQALHDFAVWREELETVEDLGAFRTLEHNLIIPDGSAEPVRVAEISAAAFRVARVPALLGRSLVEADERAGSPRVVVIAHDVWRTRFDGDPGVVGHEVRLGDAVHTVVGVMPQDFAFPIFHSLWTPLRLDPLDYGRREGPAIDIFGRLAAGATLEEAQAELTVIGRRAAADFPDTHEHLQPQILPYAELFLPVSKGNFGIAYSIHAFAAMFLILICANVGTLVFARTATRESEIVVRSALGASRGRIVMQLFTETLMLGGIASVLGLAAAAYGLRWGLSVFETTEEDLPFWFHVDLGPETVLYAGLLTLLGAAVTGVLPALKVTGRGMQARLRNAGVGGASLRFGRLSTGVILVQVAVTVAFMPILLDGVWDTAEIESSELGLPAEEYLSVRLEMDPGAAPVAPAESSGAAFHARRRASYEELERRLRLEPGVIGVTFASQLPGGYHFRHLLEVEGVAAPSRSNREGELQVQTAFVDVDFFDVSGTPILSGRGFHPGDIGTDARVVIVNQSFVDWFLDGRNPIGRRVRYLCSTAYDCDTADVQPGPWHEIVGVVEEVALTVDPDLPHNAGLYHPLAPGAGDPVHMAVHVNGSPESFAPRLQALAAAVNPNLRLHDILPLDEFRTHLLTTYLFWLRVSFLAGCIVLLLSTVGIYSIMSFTVSRRTREIGIRLALGGDPRRIVMAIFSRALVQLGLGVLAGAGLIVALLGGIKSAYGAALISAGVAVMVGAGLLACVVPTRRALRIEPTEALKEDG